MRGMRVGIGGRGCGGGGRGRSGEVGRRELGLDSALTSLAMGPEDMCGRGIEQKRVIFLDG
jgi:hypothetical protein